MKVHIRVDFGAGKLLEGSATLKPVGTGNTPAPAASHPSTHRPTKRPDFTLPLRAFVITCGGRKMTGPAKFVLVVAGLTKGDTKVAVGTETIKKAWSKMTEPLGGTFNAAYPTRAKDKAWVESPKKGSYKLRETWTSILSEGLSD
jgi:hypothetical protein